MGLKNSSSSCSFPVPSSSLRSYLRSRLVSLSSFFLSFSFMPPSIYSMLYFLSLWKDYPDKDYPSSSTFLLIWFDPSDRLSDPWENVALTRLACQSAFSIKKTKASTIYALMIFRSRDFRVPLFRERHARDSLTEWASRHHAGCRRQEVEIRWKWKGPLAYSFTVFLLSISRRGLPQLPLSRCSTSEISCAD